MKSLRPMPETNNPEVLMLAGSVGVDSRPEETPGIKSYP